ncbi:MAG: IS110 family transposase, partial [Spartobacteria bacterium]|nr:IS110 family transposase [Spartobacteria bacterium]
MDVSACTPRLGTIAIPQHARKHKQGNARTRIRICAPPLLKEDPMPSAQPPVSMPPTTYLGIDLSKATFDVTVRLPDATHVHHVFPNTPEGFPDFQTWLQGMGVTTGHACMEATNIYWEGLATWLHAHGYTVSVVNPARIKGYAMAKLQRNKTDKLDSGLIADFCATQHPTPWHPLTPEQQRLRALSRHRDDLIQTRVQQENRLRDTTDALVRTSLHAVIELLTTQIDAADAEMRKHIHAHESLLTQVTLLISIVGIQMTTAIRLLSEVPDIASYASAKAVAADVGVSPSHFESGTSVRRRTKISKQGKASVRAALYWPC